MLWTIGIIGISGGVGFGTQESSSSSSSKTKFPKSFIEDFFGFFPSFQGGANLTGVKNPIKSSLQGDIIPDAQFVRPPADTGDKLRDSLISSALPTIRRQFETEKASREEALNQSGLVTSPARFIKDGPVDRLTDQFNNSVLDLASRAAFEGAQFDEREAGRETQFNQTQFNQRLQEILGFLGITANAGRRANSRSDSLGGNFSGSGGVLS